MGKRFSRGIWWVKRDFRLEDNEALCEAIRQCDAVMPLFIIEPSLCCADETSAFHYHAWQRAAAALDQALKKRGSSLDLWIGEVCDVLEKLNVHEGFEALFSHEETGSSITYRRDRAVTRWTDSRGIVWNEFPQNGVIRRLTDRDKRQPVVRRRLIETPPAPAPGRINSWRLSKGAGDWSRSVNTTNESAGRCERLNSWPAFKFINKNAPLEETLRFELLQQLSESHAQADLRSFLNLRGIDYAGGISSPNTAFTAGSRLSAHLAWGTISLRCVFKALHTRDRELASISDAGSIRWRRSLQAFQSRLHWHDHFMQRLESAPEMEYKAINPAYRSLQYHNDELLLEAWKRGMTGIPLVDACMRCLMATGFLNFRMRAMLVSIGCFGLAQSWRSLQYPLAQLFYDYEPGIHLSQIQMQAGVVGINTIRIYNPLKQLKDHDPDAKFVKQWIPELREFDAVQIARYDQQMLGDYPAPVARIGENTKAIRDQIYAIRKSDVGRSAAKIVLKAHGSRLPGNDRMRSSSKPGLAKKRTAKQSKSIQAGQLSLNFEDNLD